MSFHIAGLSVKPFAVYFGLSNAALAELGVLRCVADKRPGFPCRVSLSDADVGESVLLLGYEHLSVATPYRSMHAIYVREFATEATMEPGQAPEVLRSRLLSLRAFSENGMMVAAEVIPGGDIEAAIAQLFANNEAAYLHVHNAKRGCYAARVDRWPD